MPRVASNDFISFNDGILDICEIQNRAITKLKQGHVRYEKKTVGVNRFWQAKVASGTVDMLIAILPVPGISRQDICIIGKEQYKILQIQDKFDQFPPCLFLSLERIQIAYKDVKKGE